MVRQRRVFGVVIIVWLKRKLSKKSSHVTRGSNEVARTLTWRCFPHTTNGGPSGCMSGTHRLIDRKLYNAQLLKCLRQHFILP